jgi:hypothetical protein
VTYAFSKSTQAPDELAVERPQFGQFQAESRVDHLSRVVLRLDLGLDDRLGQIGPRLIDRPAALDEIPLGGARVETQHRLPLLDQLARGRHPGDPEILSDGRVDRIGTLRLNLAACANHRQELSRTDRSHGHARPAGFLELKTADPDGGRERRHDHQGRNQPKAAHGRPPSAERGTVSSTSNTTAAERSGMSRGSVSSSRNTAEKLLTGRLRAGAAIGLADSKRARRATSG